MYPLNIPGRNDWNVVHNATPWIWAAGGAILTEDSTASALSGPEAVNGLQQFQRLVARYGHPGSLTSTDAASQELFAAGEFAITLSGPWFEGILLDDHAEAMPSELWSASAVPAGPEGRVSFLGGSHLAVFDSSEHPEDAMALVAYFTATEHQERASALTGLLPANVSAAVSTGTVADAFGDALASGRHYPAVPVWLDVETILQRSFSTMWADVESTQTPMTPLTPAQIERTLRDASSEIDAALDAAG